MTATREIATTTLPMTGVQPEPLHQRLADQVKAASVDGELDLTRLFALISTAYAEADYQHLLLNHAHTVMMEQTQAANARLQDAIASVSAGMEIWDKDDRIVLCNEQMSKLYPEMKELLVPGTSFQQLMERGLTLRLYDLGELSAEDWLVQRLALHNAADGKQFEVGLTDGRTVAVRETRTHAGGIVTLIADVSALKNSEKELRRSKEEAETANQTKSVFLTNMSHELRTPLNAIMGFAEALRDGHFGDLTERQRGYVHDIFLSGSHLLELINSILDLSRIEVNRLTLNESDVDLGALIDEAVKMMHSSWARNGLIVAVDVPPGLPLVHADSMRLKQVLLNLLANAAKFTPRNGYVAVSARITDTSLEITVTDTGIGIATEDIPKVLKPFGQVANPLSRRHDGVGLGLPLSKGFIELHGGQLTIDSRAGYGTRVIIELPRTRLVGFEIVPIAASIQDPD